MKNKLSLDLLTILGIHPISICILIKLDLINKDIEEIFKLDDSIVEYKYLIKEFIKYYDYRKFKYNENGNICEYENNYGSKFTVKVIYKNNKITKFIKVSNVKEQHPLILTIDGDRLYPLSIVEPNYYSKFLDSVDLDKLTKIVIPKKEYVKIDNNNVINIWIKSEDDDCEYDIKLVEINPDWYQENGTPICSCGMDLVYSHTKVFT